MNILIAVDDSTSSLESARSFRELTHQGDLTVTVLTVVGLPKTALTESIGHAVSEFVDDAIKHDEHAFASVVKLFEGSSAHLKHMTRYGHVGHCIAAAAEEINAYLIVVGAKSKSPHDHVAHESVSEYVATHATCSVLVVSPHTATQQQLDHPLRITIAYDDSKESRAAIEQFGSYLWVRNADIEVVSVVPIHAIQRDEFCCSCWELASNKFSFQPVIFRVTGWKPIPLKHSNHQTDAGKSMLHRFLPAAE